MDAAASGGWPALVVAGVAPGRAVRPRLVPRAQQDRRAIGVDDRRGGNPLDERSGFTAQHDGLLGQMALHRHGRGR
ncbi:MAG: hypothetical protein U0575_11830 [Phycisphaerales bacterium]